MKYLLLMGLACTLIVPAMAGDETAPGTMSSPSSLTPTATGGTRYGLFDGLDKRSSYGQGVFPEPFLVDDSDLEVNEGRIDWLHTQGVGNTHTDLVTGEVEKGFGNLTLEVEAPIERDSESGVHSTNFGNVDLGARYPLYEYVGPGGKWDSTIGIAAEIGVPTGSSIARNTEVVPKIFDDLRIGDHFTLQSILGYSTLIGASGDDGGVQTFEYGFVFGWTIPHDQVPIPGVQQVIPVFELSGGTQTNRADHGDNSLLANIGFRANLNPIGGVQPRLGIGYVFPVDYGASQDVHWGVVTSLVFEY
jgi:hypothetical protein